jgi:hypothetical protein
MSKRHFSGLASCSWLWGNPSSVIYLSFDNFLVKSVFTWPLLRLDRAFAIAGAKLHNNNRHEFSAQALKIHSIGCASDIPLPLPRCTRHGCTECHHMFIAILGALKTVYF